MAFRVDLRLRSPIIINFGSRNCEQTTEQSRTLECNRNTRGENSCENGEKSCMRGKKSGENGEMFCMDTVKRHLPSIANEGFESSLHVITGNKVSLSHILPFGSLLYIARDKKQIHDPKFDPRAHCSLSGTWQQRGSKMNQGIYV